MHACIHVHTFASTHTGDMCVYIHTRYTRILKAADLNPGVCMQQHTLRCTHSVPNGITGELDMMAPKNLARDTQP